MATLRALRLAALHRRMQRHRGRRRTGVLGVGPLAVDGHADARSETSIVEQLGPRSRMGLHERVEGVGDRPALERSSTCFSPVAARKGP
ncbi:hypothetical protein [Halalkalicoccus salilacus]|uniref:hypothetical protein n=1 Tax=Halalkalicoccus sp. GCM10025704 TaxID=3252662 RepID=UPI00361758D0